MDIFSVHLCPDVSVVFPGAEIASFAQAPEGPSEAAVLDLAFSLIERFDLSFDPGRWQSLSANPFLLGGRVLYYGIYGQSVEKGGSCLDEVTVGDDLYISPTARPLFCFHGGVFRTDDRALYERVRAAAEEWG